MSRVYYSLYDRLLHRGGLAVAYAKVRRAKGAPGVDGQTISGFAANLENELNRLVQELRSKTYRAQPVRCRNIGRMPSFGFAMELERDGLVQLRLRPRAVRHRRHP